jgi:metal-responsive CopG/Arc/MetJ family transcriptional regulator
MRSGMPMLSVRLPASTIEALDDLAAERGIDRSRLVRQLLDAGLRGRPKPSSEPVTENELVALLSERARAGNTAAIRTLLSRGDALDPREEAWRTLEAMVAERGS